MSKYPPLEFERPIVELQQKISDMKDFSIGEDFELSSEIASLEKKLEKLRQEIYSNLSRWQKVQLARHPMRPYTLDYINLMITDFTELHGDRYFGEDRAVISGLGYLGGQPILVIGQQKGRDTKEKLYRNFGMMHPEGYRKAMRLFNMAEKFNVPILILIDTPGAYPGLGAEERGQAEAIAKNIRDMARIKVPIVIVIIGEGASGGALGIGVGDTVMMLEYSWYSVISPEGCAAILWRDNKYAPEAAEALKVTSSDLLEMKIIDKVIPEPPTGAHSDHKLMAQRIKQEVLSAFSELKKLSVTELLSTRLKRYRNVGVYDE